MSGEPYIAHPLEAALFLADLNLDTNTIIAALLHDVIEDCGVTFEDLEARFGLEVAKLVDGVTKLTRMDYRLPGAVDEDSDASSQQTDPYSESLRKMLVAMAEDGDDGVGVQVEVAQDGSPVLDIKPHSVTFDTGSEQK